MPETNSEHRVASANWLQKPLNAVILIFAVALIVRLAVLFALHGTPYWSNQLVDAELYDDWALALSNIGYPQPPGEGPRTAPYFYSPLYPWALSLVYRVLGYLPGAVRVLQSLMGSLLCVMVYMLGRRLLSWQAALGAGLICALYAPLTFYDNLLLKTAPVTFLLFAGVWLLLLEPESKVMRHLRFLLAGVVLGLAAGMRGNVLLVGATILVGLALRAAGRKTYSRPVLFLAGLCMAVLPLTLANYSASGEFILTTYSGGFNFYEGNSAEATGYHPALAQVRQTASHEQEDAIGIVREALGRKPSPGEVSSYWFDRARRDIAERPGRWVGLLGLKVALFANGAEIPDNYNYSFMSRRLTPLRLNPVGFLLIVPFGLAGLGMAIARGGRWRIVAVIVLVYAISVVAFYVTARYRTPVVPFLALLAALAVEQIVRWFASGDYRRALIALVAVFAFFAAASRTLVPAELGFGREYYALGNMQLKEGDYADAVKSYESALEYHPYSAVIENNLGATYITAMHYSEAGVAAAKAHLQRAVDLAPGYFEAWKNLGLVHVTLGDREKASEAFNRAYELAPEHSQRKKMRRMLEAISR